MNQSEVRELGRKKLEENYMRLNRHLNAANRAIEKLVADAEQKDREVAIFKTQAEHADQRVTIYKKIVEDNLKQTQTEKDNLVTEILELKAKLKDK